MKPIKFVTFVALGALVAGCAAVAPKELINARSAYHQASMGPAAELSPAELHKAHDALILAEKSFVNEPESYKTKDLAYVAQRRSQLADASGRMAVDKAKQAKATVDFEKKQTEIITQGEKDLRSSEQQKNEALQNLSAAENQSANMEQALRNSEMQAAYTEQALRDSEMQTSNALAELAKLAALKEEERGLVLTLSGVILFRSGEASLLPTARTKLENVADALIAIKNRKIIVEGHTDSNGSDSYNQNLSQHRADSVRDFIVRRGYPIDYIRANGMGESSPIADNASSEGRANNRRVEIVIEREPTASNSSNSYTNK